MHFKKNHHRFCLVFCSILFIFLLFSIHLILIQVYNSEHLEKLAQKQHNHLVEIEPIRGTIFDRENRPLAFNTSVFSLYANPRRMTDQLKEQAVKNLSSIIDVSPERLEELLKKERYFIWLQRKLTTQQYQQVADLKIKGLGFRKESKRFYPNSSLASHIVGFAGIDNTGLEGLELAFNRELKGRPGKAWILRDARQKDIMVDGNFLPPVHGFDIHLTIDETIQFIAEKALQEAFVEHNAKSGSIIVLDVRTGEVLALANRPTYNLQNPQGSNIEDRTNRAISHIYEPGSIFKIVAAAGALEEDVFQEEDIIDCEGGKYRVGPHVLNDHKPHDEISFQRVIEVSSNIGTHKIAAKLGEEKFYDYIKRFRFGEITEIDLKGEVRGFIRHPKYWSKTSMAALPMGHEITATPLQLVSALAAVANDGVYMKPYVVSAIKDQNNEEILKFNPEVVDRVISPETAKRLTDILVGVVDNGTGRNAQIDGIKVAGKTGTAQKVIDGKYSHGHYYSSFMGFAPADNPQIAAIVVFDDPSPRYYGGTVCAPVFQKVVEDTLKYLAIVEKS